VTDEVEELTRKPAGGEMQKKKAIQPAAAMKGSWDEDIDQCKLNKVLSG
jgi:hypothetical protein